MTENKHNKEKGWRRLKHKYHVVIYQGDTLEEKTSFRLSRFQVIILSIFTTLLLVVATTIIIAYTPLREYIPGYSDPRLYEDLYALMQKADSLEHSIAQKDVYFDNLRLILEGHDFSEDTISEIDIYAPLRISTDSITLDKSAYDSILRAEFESDNQYNLLTVNDISTLRNYSSTIPNFFIPLTGLVTSAFDRNLGHFGVDIVAPDNQIIKATLDGTVVYSGWTMDGGYTIGIQHDGNYFSTYKHNSVILKKEGDFVEAGEPIAIVGESGELSTGPHLHFEIWYNGTAINPLEFMNFEVEQYTEVQKP